MEVRHIVCRLPAPARLRMRRPGPCASAARSPFRAPHRESSAPRTTRRATLPAAGSPHTRSPRDSGSSPSGGGSRSSGFSHETLAEMWPNLHLSILMRSHAKESFTQHAHRQLLLKSEGAGAVGSDGSSPRERAGAGGSGAQRASDAESALASDGAGDSAEMMLNRSELFSALMHMGIYPTEEELVATEEKLHIGVDADHHETPISQSGFLAIVLDYEVKPLVQKSPDDRRFVRALRRHFIAHARMVTIDVRPQGGRATSASPRGGVDDDARGFARSLGLSGESAAKARELFAMLTAVGGAAGAELRAKLSEVVRGATPSASADGDASSSSAAAAATAALSPELGCGISPPPLTLPLPELLRPLSRASSASPKEGSVCSALLFASLLVRFFAHYPTVRPSIL